MVRLTPLKRLCFGQVAGVVSCVNGKKNITLTKVLFVFFLDLMLMLNKSKWPHMPRSPPV